MQAKQNKNKMKKNLLTSIFLCVCYGVFAQIPLNQAVKVSGDWQDGGTAGYYYELTANNEDYCDYYLSLDLLNYGLFRGSQAHHFTSVHRGYSSIMRLTPARKNSYQGAQFYYATLRGNIYLNVNVDFQYALPIKAGDSVRVFPKENSDYTLVFDLKNTTTDTIFACRRGIVCDDQYSDNSAKGSRGYKGKANQITIYHKDGSFGEYKGFTKPLVLAGRTVEMGTPIAIVQREGDSPKFVEFAVYFLDKNKVENKETGSKHTHLRPFFRTTAGNLRLESETNYFGERNNEMLMQDMSNKEIKKFMKDKK